MDTDQAILTKVDIKQHSPKNDPADVTVRVLEGARASGTGNNKQHLRFILVQNKESIKKLAEDSTSGPWVAGADFAVIVLTDPKLSFHLIDTGRAVQQMQLSAWNSGVISGVYTGIKEEAMRKDFGFPADIKPTMVVGFGYPVKKIVGKKNRIPISELAFIDKFGNKFDPKKPG